MPQRFANQLGRGVNETVSMNDSFLSKLLGGLVAGGTAAYVLHKGDSYEVFQCSDCLCEVCYAIMSDEGGRQKVKIGEIATCRD